MIAGVTASIGMPLGSYQGSAPNGDWLDHSANFFAGWGDTLTGDGTSKWRQYWGINDGIDTSSKSYRAGQTTGAIHIILIGATSAGAGTRLVGLGKASIGSLSVSTGAASVTLVPATTVSVGTVAAGAIAVGGGGLIGYGTSLLKKRTEQPAEGSSSYSVNQMNQQIQRGQAPRSVSRVDRGKIQGEQDHIHFSDGSAVNVDGTMKHGTHSLAPDEIQWMQGNGWPTTHS